MRQTAAAGVLLAWALAGCATNDPATAVERAAKAYAYTFADGHGEGAYAMLSTRCQNQIDRDEYVELVPMAAVGYAQTDPEDVKIAEVEVTYDMATVVYDLDGFEGEFEEQWVYEDDRWRVDTC